MKRFKYIIAFCFTFFVVKAYCQTASLYTAKRLVGVYSSIQAAVDAAYPYDSIVLSADTFYEHEINGYDFPIKLQGTIDNGDTTVINASGYGITFYYLQGNLKNIIFSGNNTKYSSLALSKESSIIFGGSGYTIEGFVSFRNSYITSNIFYTNIVSSKNAILDIRNNVFDLNQFGSIKVDSSILCDLGREALSKSYNLEDSNCLINFINNHNKKPHPIILLRYPNKKYKLNIRNNTGGSGVNINIVYDLKGPNVFNLSDITIIGNKFELDKDCYAFTITNNSTSTPLNFILNNSYIYNPAPVGQKRVELYCDNSANLSFESSDTWWGSSDTAGLFAIKAPSSFKLHSWAKAHWYAVPYGKSPFTLTNVQADIRRSDGTAFADSSFRAMRGDFYASGGYFSPTSAAINPANVVASDYHLPATGPYSVMAVIDADTFRPSKEKLGVVEDAALTTTTLSVAPNPFTESFKIYGESKGQYRVQLLDISGKRIVQFEGSLTAVNANMAQQCSQLSSGAYLLNVEAPNAQKQQFKLVKQ